MNWLRRHLLSLIAASLLIGLGVSLWLSGPELARTLLSLPAWVLPLGFSMIVLGWNINALRIRLLLAGQGVRTRHAQNLSGRLPPLETIRHQAGGRTLQRSTGKSTRRQCMTSLFDPLALRDLILKNRVIMAPDEAPRAE